MSTVNLPLMPLIPAAGAVVNGLVGRRWFGHQLTATIACATMASAVALSVWSLVAISALPPETRVLQAMLGDWIPAIPLQTTTGIEMFKVTWTLRLDPLSAIMALLTAGVGFLVHLYATGYMRDENRSDYARFFSYLSLSCAFVLLLVLSGNFLILFAGWQGTALCSFLLIGFWRGSADAANDAMRTFVVNGIGDCGLLVAILLVYFTFGTLDFREVAASVTSMPVASEHVGAISGICLGLWIAAMTRSAQVPLHGWFRRALEGPAPVSALISAATMLPAGVYVIVRNWPLFEQAPVVMTVVTSLGMLTALMAGVVALVQDDIQRVLAYSTTSQLGVIFTALGTGAFAPGVFHLVTLGVSQSLLLLGSGALIRAMAGERNMRRMGGLRQYLPATFVTMTIGALAVIAFPPLSGFFSCSEISWSLFGGHGAAWAVTSATTVLTAASISRMMRLTFGGGYRGPSLTQSDPGSREAPMTLIVPLGALALASIVLGFIGVSAPGRPSSIVHLLALTAQAPQTPLSPAATVALLSFSTLLPLAGILIAGRFHRRESWADHDLAARRPDDQLVPANPYSFDEWQGARLVNGLFSTARRLSRFDDRVINGGVNACGWAVQLAGWIVHMIDKHVVNRIADRLVDSIGWIVRR